MPSKRPQLTNDGACQKCGMHMLYHDYDPRHRHNGYTCGACGFEQTLNENGLVSLITTNRGKTIGAK